MQDAGPVGRAEQLVPPENDVVDGALANGWCLATAESVTGGLVARRLAAVPGSGPCFRGGLVAYANGVKHAVLGVPDGPVVTEAAARHMAEGACRLLDADVAVATTGVAGPDELEGKPVGTVWIGVAWRGVDGSLGAEADLVCCEGTPDQVAALAAEAALRRLGAAVRLRAAVTAG